MRKRNVCIWSFAAYCALMIWLLFGREQYHTVSDYWQQVALNFNPVPFETIVRFVGFLVGDYSDALKRHAIVNLVGNVIMFLPGTVVGTVSSFVALPALGRTDHRVRGTDTAFRTGWQLRL